MADPQEFAELADAIAEHEAMAESTLADRWLFEEQLRRGEETSPDERSDRRRGR